MLPLHQVRNKLSYHIWIPIDDPAGDVDVSSSFDKGKESPSNQQILARPNRGKLRVKLTWEQAQHPQGKFPERVVSLLETDLLLANAVSTSRHVPGNILTLDVASDIRSYMRQAWKCIERDEEPSQNLMDFISQQQDTGNESDGTGENLILKQLRLLLRGLPTVGHALCSKLAEVNRQDTLLQYFYSQVTGEMLLRRTDEQFEEACVCLMHFCKDIVGRDECSPVLEDTFQAFIYYIHSTDNKVTQDHLFSLLSGHKKPGQRVLNKKEIAQRVSEIDMQPMMSTNAMELGEVRFKQKLRVYSALIGSSNTTALKRYCRLEDQFLYGGKSNLQKEIPACFAELHRSLLEIQVRERQTNSDEQAVDDAPASYELNLNEFAADSESRDPDPKDAKLRTTYQQVFNMFWSHYTGFIRYHNEHIFVFPIKLAQRYIHERDWKNVSLLLLPFNPLRPLAILHFWDGLPNKTSSFAIRRSLIRNVWVKRTTKDFYPWQKKCSELRLVEWCERMTLYMDVIDIILNIKCGEEVTDDSVAQAGWSLLCELQSSSVIEALRGTEGYLNSLMMDNRDQQLIDTMNRHNNGELEHDTNVLRSYFAIRHAMEMMFNDGDAASKAPRWEKAKLLILQMSSWPTGQLATLEKIFALLFICKEDVQVIGQSAKSKKKSKKQTKLREFYLKPPEILLLLNSLQKLLAVEIKPLLQNRSQTFRSIVDAEDRGKERDEILQRVTRLEKWVEDGLARISILAQAGLPPTMNNLTASLVVIGAHFLQQGQLEEARLDPMKRYKDYPDELVSQIADAHWLVEEEQTWAELVGLADQPEMLADADLIVSFRRRRRERSGDTELESPETSDLQDLLFCMDFALTYSHKLTAEAYQKLMQTASELAANLKATNGAPLREPDGKPQTRVDDSLLDFCLSYAKDHSKISAQDFSLQRMSAAPSGSATLGTPEGNETEQHQFGAEAWARAHSRYNEGLANASSQDEGSWTSLGAFRKFLDAINSTGESGDSKGLRLLKYLAQTVESDGVNEQKHSETSDDRQHTREQQEEKQKQDHDADCNAGMESNQMKDNDDKGVWRTLTDPDEICIVARKLLPPLAAVRHILKEVSLEEMEAILDYTKAYVNTIRSELPWFARWVDWRLEAYDVVMTVYEDEVNKKAGLLGLSKASQLLEKIRKLIAMESSVADHRAYFELISAYVQELERSTASKSNKGEKETEEDYPRGGGGCLDPSERLALMMRLLDLVDSAQVPASGSEDEKTVQSLLNLLITEVRGTEKEHLQPNFILRLIDVQKMCTWTLENIQNWTDTQITAMVLLKCLSCLRAEIEGGLPRSTGADTSALASKISTPMPDDELFLEELYVELEVRYYMIVIHKQLQEAVGAETLQATKPRKKMANYTHSGSLDGSLGGAAIGNNNNTAAMLKKAKPLTSLSRQPDFSSWQSMERWCWSDLEAVIYRLIKWKQVLLADQLFAICRNHYASNARLLLDDQKKLHKQLALSLEAAHIAILMSDSSSTANRVSAVKRLEALPAQRKFQIGQEVIIQLEADQTHQRHVVAYFLDKYYRRNPRRHHETDSAQEENKQATQDALLGGGAGEPDEAGLKTHARSLYPSLSEKDAAWLHSVLAATKMILTLPKTLQADPQLSTLPRAHQKVVLWGRDILSVLLSRGHAFLPTATRVFGIFYEYSKSLWWDGIDFLLSFATRALVETQHMGVGTTCMQIALNFRPLERAAHAVDRQKVAKCCLDIANSLSWKLSKHPHPLLVLHLIKVGLIR